MPTPSEFFRPALQRPAFDGPVLSYIVGLPDISKGEPEGCAAIYVPRVMDNMDPPKKVDYSPVKLDRSILCNANATSMSFSDTVSQSSYVWVKVMAEMPRGVDSVSSQNASVHGVNDAAASSSSIPAGGSGPVSPSAGGLPYASAAPAPAPAPSSSGDRVDSDTMVVSLNNAEISSAQPVPSVGDRVLVLFIDEDPKKPVVLPYVM